MLIAKDQKLNSLKNVVGEHRNSPVNSMSVMLNNHIWLENTQDGRFYDEQDNEWAEVFEVDDTYNFDDSSTYKGEWLFKGFVMLSRADTAD